MPNCVPLEPKAVHVKRDYDKITKEVARMIEEGMAQPEEIRFICSEFFVFRRAFFVFRRDGEDFLAQFGGVRIPCRIQKEEIKASYENGTVTLGDAVLKVNSVGIRTII